MHNLIIVLKNKDVDNDDAVGRLEDDLSSLQHIDPCADYICGREDDADFETNLSICREVMEPLGFEFDGPTIIFKKDKILERYTTNIEQAVANLKLDRTTHALYKVSQAINAGMPIYDGYISSALETALTYVNYDMVIDYFIDYHS